MSSGTAIGHAPVTTMSYYKNICSRYTTQAAPLGSGLFSKTTHVPSRFGGSGCQDQGVSPERSEVFTAAPGGVPRLIWGEGHADRSRDVRVGQTAMEQDAKVSRSRLRDCLTELAAGDWNGTGGISC